MVHGCSEPAEPLAQWCRHGTGLTASGAKQLWLSEKAPLQQPSAAALRLRMLLNSAPCPLAPFAGAQAARLRPLGQSAGAGAVGGAVRCDMAMMGFIDVQDYDEDVDCREGPARYAPFLARAKATFLQMRQMAMGSIRYLAYASDVGESFRPVVHPWIVNFTYGVAGAYVIGDVALAGYRAKRDGHAQDVVAATCLRSATFQVLASLAMPAVIIHTAVHQAKRVVDQPSISKRLHPRIIRFGPCGVGLGLIPFLPMLDEPCEWFVDGVFDRVYPRWRDAHSHHHMA
mmetsp:Transcript_48667/g.141912  ORF Transcript_48667/g.141912 Transcript_48667/m.141912 type:complete len:286 (-) Transcript_48667:127-984(-)